MFGECRPLSQGSRRGRRSRRGCGGEAPKWMDDGGLGFQVEGLKAKGLRVFLALCCCWSLRISVVDLRVFSAS